MGVKVGSEPKGPVEEEEQQDGAAKLFKDKYKEKALSQMLAVAILQRKYISRYGNSVSLSP
jgi:hypothetical protein